MTSQSKLNHVREQKFFRRKCSCNWHISLFVNKKLKNVYLDIYPLESNNNKKKLTKTVRAFVKGRNKIVKKFLERKKGQ